MPPLFVDPSWYNRVWLTERTPSRTAQLGQRAGLVARRLASTVSAAAALYALFLQQASDNSPSLL